MRVILAALGLAAGAAQADVPAVLADIAPVQSLAAQVMGDLGTPQLLLDPTVDPHDMQMRPSQARLMAGADVIVWMGTELTPWLPRAIDNLSGHATSVDLLGLPDLPLRIDTDADADADTDTDAGAGAEAATPQDAADHGTTDPHAWLDPLNAARFLDEIARALADRDPHNADIYRANAAAAQARLAALTDAVGARLAPVRAVTLIPYHDAYRYFFTRFGLTLSGSIADTEAAAPGAARLADLRARVAAAARSCVFTEFGANEQLIRTVQPAPRRIPALDGLGVTVAPGPALYGTVLRQMADTIATCLDE